MVDDLASTPEAWKANACVKYESLKGFDVVAVMERIKELRGVAQNGSRSTKAASSSRRPWTVGLMTTENSIMRFKKPVRSVLVVVTESRPECRRPFSA